jgi:putative sigma-54 modulation protein
MNLQIRTNGTKLTGDLRAFIEHRTAKLDRLVDHIVDAQVELRTSRQRSGAEVTVAQITLHTRRHILRAEERASEPTKAVDEAVDKLVRQVRRYHDKRTNRKRRMPTAEVIGEIAAARGQAADDSYNDDEMDRDGESDDGERSNGVVRTKRFSVKPMPVDEAIEQLELLGHDFYLFHNADEDQVNLLYRRRDGSFGLLAPSRS